MGTLLVCESADASCNVWAWVRGFVTGDIQRIVFENDNQADQTRDTDAGRDG